MSNIPLWDDLSCGSKRAQYEVEPWESDDLVVKLDLPGVRRKDIEVIVESGLVRVMAERNPQDRDKEEAIGDQHFGRRPDGREVFQRNLHAPFQIEDVAASFASGVLTITISSVRERNGGRRIAVA